jgi:hypothetical protein
MATREDRINGLTDQQVLSIIDSLAGEFATSDTPEGKDAQAQALVALMSSEGHPVDVAKATKADPAATAAAGRELLLMMARVPDMQPSLDEWLDHPPTHEAAAVPLILAAPVVLTGCIVLLQMAGHVRIKRDRDGRWAFDYDPSTPTPFDKTMKGTIGILAKLMGKLAPAG